MPAIATVPLIARFPGLADFSTFSNAFDAAASG
jgi:hypothetical protein